MDQPMWKPTIHVRLTAQEAPAVQTALFAPSIVEAPACQHVAIPDAQQLTFSGSAVTLCALCGATIE